MGYRVFAREASFDEAFPLIKEVKMVVREIDYGKRNAVFTKNTMPGEVWPCSNPECKHGGLRIGEVLHEAYHNGDTYRKGMVSCPSEVRPGRHCMNLAEVEVTIVYRDEDGGGVPTN